MASVPGSASALSFMPVVYAPNGWSGATAGAAGMGTLATADTPATACPWYAWPCRSTITDMMGLPTPPDLSTLTKGAGVFAALFLIGLILFAAGVFTLVRSA